VAILLRGGAGGGAVCAAGLGAGPFARRGGFVGRGRFGRAELPGGSLCPVCGDGLGHRHVAQAAI
jgi:hypothetical protein